MRLAHRLPFCLLVLASNLAIAQETLPEEVQFNRDVRPILSDNCFHCHGPDGAQRQADLRLDREEDIFANRDGVKILSPGKPEESELYRRIASSDEVERMPPADSGRELSAREIELIKRWISEGAKWQPHWSFIPPTRPPVPKVNHSDWPQNPIDRFILARLEREGLSPSPEADKRALVRRVTLDLTGLPATAAEVEAFLEDTDPGAYERLVDRLMASPRYGERMAMDWLDAARYADTSGYQSDGPRDMWRWRDWVIEAYNAKMPFDQFTIEQLAGDLLPNATLSQKIATGFNRNHRGNAEGGIIPEEYACEYVVDRVETTFTVWMGLTMGCARCHDHKFDPFSQKEFYQLYAYFNNIPEFGRAIKEGNSPPFLPAPTEEQQRRLKRLDQELELTNETMLTAQWQSRRSRKRWEEQLGTNSESKEVQWFPGDDLLAHYPLDGNLAVLVHPPIPISAGQKPMFAEGPIGQAAKYEGQGTEITGLANFGYFDKFSFSFWIRPEKAEGTVLSKMKDTARAEGYALQLERGKLQVNLVKRWLDDAIRVETKEPIKLNRWQHVAVTYDGSRIAKGIKVYVDGAPVELKVNLDLINQSFATLEPFRIGQGGGPESGFHGLLDDLRIYAGSLSPESVAMLATKEPINEIAALPMEKRTPGQKLKLHTYYMEHQAAEEARKLWNRRKALRKQRAALIESFPTVMVMHENPTIAKTHVLVRGQYDRPGEVVERNVPATFPPLPDGVPNNRLGFAKWLVDPKHPLTARVAVNRLWQLSFGTGLVKTTEDFGLQGGRPSHPELLDWLAVELIESGWNLQHIQKLIVTSAVYRQSSKVTPALVQRDPENRRLARGPRYRLPAGMIRDQALAVSGLLAERIGGPSVKPYQPEGLWTELANEKPYQHDHGENLYRRSLYTFWKRTIGPPTLLNFDASTRETCQVRPVRTNTPLQALTLMNDPIFIESARHLAEVILKSEPPTSVAGISELFSKTLGREPSARELAVLTESWQSQRSRFEADPKAAEELLCVGESPHNPKLNPIDHAAYIIIANLIMNLDEFVTRE